MSVAPGTLDLLEPIVVWMSRLAALAAAINALELLAIRRDFTDDGAWRASLLAESWGPWRGLLEAGRFTGVLRGQLACAIMLAALPGTGVGSVAAAALAFTTWLSALRFGGNVNGGADAMLFTVLGGLTVAQLPAVAPVVHEAGVLYVAAQLSLSYLRAGVVKVKERTWWTGDALAAFLALPAYGVPMPVIVRGAQTSAWWRAALCTASIGVMTFECFAVAAWFDPIAWVAVIAAALLFHTSVAALFGLNRFLLAWGAALPSLWYAMHRAA